MNEVQTGKRLTAFLPNPFYQDNELFKAVTNIAGCFNIRPASLMELAVDFTIAVIKSNENNVAKATEVMNQELHELLISGENEEALGYDAFQYCSNFINSTAARIMNPLKHSIAMSTSKLTAEQYQFCSIDDFNQLILKEEDMIVDMDFLIEASLER